MLVKDLILKLQETDKNNNVFIRGNDGLCYDFNGLSYDDINDIELYIVSGDKEV